MNAVQGIQAYDEPLAPPELQNLSTRDELCLQNTRSSETCATCRPAGSVHNHAMHLDLWDSPCQHQHSLLVVKVLDDIG